MSNEGESSEFVFPSKDMSVLEEQKKKVRRQRARLNKQFLHFDSDSESDGLDTNTGRTTGRTYICGKEAQSGQSETSLLSNESGFSRKSVIRRTPNVIATDHRNWSRRSINLNKEKPCMDGAHGEPVTSSCRQSPSFNALEQRVIDYAGDTPRPSSSHEFRRKARFAIGDGLKRPTSAISLNKQYAPIETNFGTNTEVNGGSYGARSASTTNSATSVNTIVEANPENYLRDPCTGETSSTDEELCDYSLNANTDEGPATLSIVISEEESQEAQVIPQGENKEDSEQPSSFSAETEIPVCKGDDKRSSGDGAKIGPQQHLASVSPALFTKYPSPQSYGVLRKRQLKGQHSLLKLVKAVDNNQKVDIATYGKILNLFVTDQPSEANDETASLLLKLMLDEKEKLTELFYNMKRNDEEVTYSLGPNQILDNIETFVMQPVPPGFIMKCRITRDRKGIDKAMYPNYYMHLEREDGKKNLLLVSRKRKKSTTSNYLISTDPANLFKDSGSAIGKVRSNLLGTNFSAYDNRISFKQYPYYQHVNSSPRTFQYREELATVLYETNVLGFNGPRKMGVVIPQMINAFARVELHPAEKKNTMSEKIRRDDMKSLHALKNVTPQWDLDTQSFVLNFHGRVTQASVKNFQLATDANDGYCCLQFGRVAEDVFHLDFGFPMCPLQAFSIVLTGFDTKIACE